MRREVCVLITWGVIAGAGHAAEAQSPWYITGSAGALLREDASQSVTVSNRLGRTAPLTDTAGFSTGPQINLGIGYKLPLGFRLEGEFGYGHNTISSVSPLVTNGSVPSLNGSKLSLQSGGARSTYTVTVNGFYDLPVSWPIVPFIGGGLGVAHIVGDAAYFAGSSGVPRFTYPGGQITNGVVLAEIGATYKINENWAIGPLSRFEHIFTGHTAFPYNARIFQLSSRYSF